MFCENCGNELEEDSAFCPNCGYKIETQETARVVDNEPVEDSNSAPMHVCPSCGASIEDDAAFCEFCGAPIVKENAQTATETEPIPPSEATEPTEESVTTQTQSAGDAVSETENPEPAAEAHSDSVIEAEDSAAPIESVIAESAPTTTTNLEPTSQQIEKQNAPQMAESASGQAEGQNSSSQNIAAKFTVKNLFAQVFKMHMTDERQKIMQAGIVPPQDKDIKIDSDNLQPWLYSRVFLVLFVVFAIFEICLLSFNNSNMMPGVMVLGSLMMPFAILTMYFELNAYRDISFYSVIGIFLLGGALSLLLTLFLYAIVPMGEEMNFLNASLISLVEEIGKVVIAAVLIKRRKDSTLLHGLLIGGAVGAGFAVFESAGYAFNGYLNAHDYNKSVEVYNQLSQWYDQINEYADSIGEMNLNIFLRAVLAFGGHTAWAAIEGASFAKEKSVNLNFVKIFGICFVLHALWDTTTPAIWVKLSLLCLAAWYVIISLIAKFVEKNNREEIL